MQTNSETKLFQPKNEKKLRIYAWSTLEIQKFKGCLKVGQTTRDVNKRIKESQGVAQVEYTLEINEEAYTEKGILFTDTDVRRRLVEKGFVNVSGEWMLCAKEDVLKVIKELKSGQQYLGNHVEEFEMRNEQREAVLKTHKYFNSIWKENSNNTPRFLWNAKMRFGKTFTAYQLAKKMKAKNILVVTFKPAVEDAWKTDLQSHKDFEGWRYFSKNTEKPVFTNTDKTPLVYFGSFQDLLGKDKTSGTIKPKNEWIHTTSWDLVVFDEYHFGAWREKAKELFEGEDEKVAKQEFANEYGNALDLFDEALLELNESEDMFLPISSRAYLYLSGTPFKAIANGEFIEEQIFNWTYTDEQEAKKDFSLKNPEKPNPYASLPEMRLLTYQMPDEIISIANQGEFNEFDLNSFFAANGEGVNAKFKHKDDVQKWLDIIKGTHIPTQIDSMKTGSRPPFPYSDSRLLPYLQHSFWFLPSVASCYAMKNLLTETNNKFWHDYEVIIAAGPSAGIGIKALPPVRDKIRNGFDSKTITLSCSKLTTGVTVRQWSSILMLKNLKSPETYFQAAFRVQSPWSIKNPNGDDPHYEEIIKPICFVFDFAPTRALRQIAEYGQGLSPEKNNPEESVEDLVKFLPVLAYDGANMIRVDAGGILDIALAGTSATLLAKKWESAILVNVDNDTLKKIINNKKALDAVMNIEGFRSLGSSVFETVVNKSESVRNTKRDKGDELNTKEKRELSDEEKEYKSNRKKIQEKLIKFATRIPAFMYLTDFRENTLHDVITKLEPDLFKSVTGLTVEDFELLVSLGVFNATQMNQAVFSFRRYEDASLSYTGIDSHPKLKNYGLYDTVVEIKE